MRWLTTALAWCRRYWLWVVLPLVAAVGYVLGRRREVVVVPEDQAVEANKVLTALTKAKGTADTAALQQHGAAVSSVNDSSVQAVSTQVDRLLLDGGSTLEVNAVMGRAGKKVQQL